MKVDTKNPKKIKKIQGPGEGGRPPPGTEAPPSITMATSVSAPPGAAIGQVHKDLGRARGICWTLYDYDQYLAVLDNLECEYQVYGYETCPTTGRKHLQGYTYFSNPHSLNKFSESLGNCHVEKQTKGTPKQAADYCKEDGDWRERGTPPTQGKRTDWEAAVSALKTKDVLEVILEQPQLAPAQRALREIKSMYLKPLHREVNVYVLYGAAGSGKTRWAYDFDKDLYKKPVGDWYDGYQGQKTLLLDDFYGWIKYHDLLHVCDRYPLNCPVKGGYVWAQWDTVIITSNDPPQLWYKEKGLTPALRRRIKKILYVENIDGQIHYNPQEEDDEEAQQEDDD